MGIGGGLAGLAGIISLFYYPFRNEGGRGAGAFGNPNPFANFLLIAIPFTFAYLLAEKKYFDKLLWGGGFVLGCLGFLAARSRGAMMALIAYPLSLATVLARKDAFFVLFLVMVLLTGHLHLVFSGYQSSYLIQLMSYVLSTPELYQRDRHYIAEDFDQIIRYDTVQWLEMGRFENLPNTLAARMMIWGQAFEDFEEHPIFGVGIGRGMFSGVPYDCKTFNNAFCAPLTVATEMGLIGLFFYLWIIYESFVLVIDGFKNAETYEDQLLMAAIGAGFFSFHIHSLIEDFIFAIMCNWMYGILTGIIAVSPFHIGAAGNEEADTYLEISPTGLT